MAESLKKVIKITLDANKTVVVVCSATTIDLTNDTILYDGHGFKNGDVVSAITSSALPTGISANTAYYVRVLSHDKFYLYDTYAHAIDLTAVTGLVNITVVGAGNMTLRKNGYGVCHLGEIIPAGAIVTGVFTKTNTTVTSGGSAQIALGNGTDAIVAATAYGTIFASTTTYVATLAVTTGVAITVNTELIATVSNSAALTDGIGDIYIEYVD